MTLVPKLPLHHDKLKHQWPRSHRLNQSSLEIRIPWRIDRAGSALAQNPTPDHGQEISVFVVKSQNTKKNTLFFLEIHNKMTNSSLDESVRKIPPKRTSSLMNSSKRDKKPPEVLVKQLEHAYRESLLNDDSAHKVRFADKDGTEYGRSDGIHYSIEFSDDERNSLNDDDDPEMYIDQDMQTAPSRSSHRSHLKRRLTLSSDWKITLPERSSSSMEWGNPDTSFAPDFIADFQYFNRRPRTGRRYSSAQELGRSRQIILKNNGRRALKLVQSFELLNNGGSQSNSHQALSDGEIPSELSQIADSPVDSLSLTPEKRDKMKQARYFILLELLETERNYIRNLEAVMNLYREPLLSSLNTAENKIYPSLSKDTQHLQKQKIKQFVSLTNLGSTTESIFEKPIIPLVDIKIIFAHLDDVYDFSKKFLADLEEVVSFWKDSEAIWELMDDENFSNLPRATKSAGNLFLSRSTQWKIYLKFVDNYSAAKEAIRRSEKTSPSFTKFIQDHLQKHRSFQHADLANFLIFPIQRVTRYVLLLQDLKKNTPLDHPDYPMIIAALSDMRTLANTVNEVKRNEEEMTRMFHVVRTVIDIPPTIISAQRRLSFECDFKDVTKKNMMVALAGTVTVQNSGMTMVPSLASMLPPSGNESPKEAREKETSSIRAFIFSDMIVFAKLKPRKKWKTKFNEEKPKEWQLFRISWLKNVDIIDLGNIGTSDSNSSKDGSKGRKSKSSGFRFGYSSASKKSCLIKVVIRNSDMGQARARKKFLTELQEVNQNLHADAVGKENTDLKVASKLHLRRSKTHRVGPISSISEETDEEMAFSDSQANPHPSQGDRLPSVGSIERMALMNLKKKEIKPVNGIAQKTRKSRTESHQLSSSMPNIPPELPEQSIYDHYKSSAPPTRAASLVPALPNIPQLVGQTVFGKQKEAGLVSLSPSVLPISPVNPNLAMSEDSSDGLELTDKADISCQPSLVGYHMKSDGASSSNRSKSQASSSSLSSVTKSFLSRSLSVNSSLLGNSQELHSSNLAGSTESAPLKQAPADNPKLQQHVVTETFIMDIEDPKKKNELMLIWERLKRKMQESE